MCYERQTSNTSTTYHIVCSDQCRPIIINYWMELHREEMRLKYDEFIAIYLSDGEKFRSDFYPMPSEVAKDTAYRKALRVARVAEVAATISGFSVTFTALKYLYYSSEIIKKFIAGDLLTYR